MELLKNIYTQWGTTTTFLSGLVVFLGGIVTFSKAVTNLRKFYQWLRPIRIEPSFILTFNNSGPDKICAKIINKSTTTQYIVHCRAIGTYSLLNILIKHIRNPLLPPRLYPNVWFGGSIYNLMEGESIKLELHQPVDLSCELFDHPLNAMFTPYFFIDVELSSGKTIRSKKLQSPERWKYIGRNSIKGEPA